MTRKKKSKELLEAERKYNECLKRIGYTGTAKNRVKNIPTVVNEQPVVRYTYPTSDYIPVGVICAKTSVDDWKWKKSIQESPETIEEIERKKRRVAIAYNKGAYQYITDGDDLTSIGKK